tara:strand:- start:1404 stop:2840 length:1437 start_codon:yes stop_codon:yes gene_type:complete
LINERLLRSWIRCRRKAWLDKYGDQNKRLWSSHRTLQLDHQHRSLLALIKESEDIGTGIRACEEGASLVIGLKIKGKTPSGKLIEANPPLIKKVDGESKWGEFSYIPVITRQGHKITREHKLSLAFTGLLLDQLQGSPVNKGLAISKTIQKLEKENVHISQSLNNLLIQNLRKIDRDIKFPEAPPLTFKRHKCSICTWKGLCDSEASSQGHLSEISGVGAKRIELLKNLGINNLSELATSNPFKLENNLGDFHGEIAHQIIDQAIVQLKKKEKRLKDNPSLPEMRLAKGALLYDIESDPDAKHDFLHGLIIIKRNNHGKWESKKLRYVPILTLTSNSEQEKLTWKRIKKKLNCYKNWPILHYGETESLSLYRLAERQNASEKELKEIKSRCIDIHNRIKSHWRLPINNYGLKSVANFIGFKWSEKGVDGSKALLWWRQWKLSKRSNKNSSKNLQKIFKYNKDDCLATWEITNWLLNQD